MHETTQVRQVGWNGLVGMAGILLGLSGVILAGVSLGRQVRFQGTVSSVAPVLTVATLGLGVLLAGIGWLAAEEWTVRRSLPVPFGDHPRLFGTALAGLAAVAVLF
jgi:hypothetical protein